MLGPSVRIGTSTHRNSTKLIPARTRMRTVVRRGLLPNRTRCSDTDGRRGKYNRPAATRCVTDLLSRSVHREQAGIAAGQRNVDPRGVVRAPIDGESFVLSGPDERRRVEPDRRIAAEVARVFERDEDAVQADGTLDGFEMRSRRDDERK